MGIGLPRLPVGLIQQNDLQAVASLFANGAPGVWFDRQDLGSMYQDAAGTTACAVGSPVGLALDKSKGAVRGAELVVNGSCTGTSGWTGLNLTNPGGATIKVDTGAGGSEAQAANTTPVIAGRWYEVAFDLIGANNSGAIVVGGTRVVIPGPVSNSGAKRMILQAGATSASGLVFASNTPTAGFFIEVDNVSCREIPGNHATQGTSASRPILRQDASGRYYLEYDGFDDGMATAAMNFTTTDKLTVLAGVYKASDAATGVVCEHGIGGTDVRAWTLNAPRGAAALDYGLDMRGVAGSETVRTTSFAAPHLAVLTGQMDYAGAALADEVKLRVNGGGVQTVSGVQNAEVGFGSYPLYIGNRGGASLPFNGRDYGLIVVGRALSATEISRAERFLASRMGVAL